MKIALVTGANKSIGFEVAQQLAQKGIYVYLGSRNVENGIEAVGKLKAKGLNNVEVIPLNITDDESVTDPLRQRCAAVVCLLSRLGIAFDTGHLSPWGAVA